MVFSKKLKKVSNPTIVSQKAKSICGPSVKIVDSRAKSKSMH